jgi:tripartite-type tricarboxylate transporter receptor subunit TctC
VRTPRDIVDKLFNETLAALQSPKVAAKLSALGVDPIPMKPAAFDGYVREEILLNATLVKATGLKAE